MKYPHTSAALLHWDRTGTKLGPNWDQTGTRLGPEWDRLGQTGTDLVSLLESVCPLLVLDLWVRVFNVFVVAMYLLFCPSALLGAPGEGPGPLGRVWGPSEEQGPLQSLV